MRARFVAAFIPTFVCFDACVCVPVHCVCVTLFALLCVFILVVLHTYVVGGERAGLMFVCSIRAGIRNIIDEVTGGDKTFPRLKIGIGRPSSPDVPVYEHVLTKFKDDEVAALENDTWHDACDAVRNVLANGLEKAMTAVNNNNKK